MTEPWFC